MSWFGIFHGASGAKADESDDTTGDSVDSQSQSQSAKISDVEEIRTTSLKLSNVLVEAASKTNEQRERREPDRAGNESEPSDEDEDENGEISETPEPEREIINESDDIPKVDANNGRKQRSSSGNDADKEKNLEEIDDPGLIDEAARKRAGGQQQHQISRSTSYTSKFARSYEQQSVGCQTEQTETREFGVQTEVIETSTQTTDVGTSRGLANVDHLQNESSHNNTMDVDFPNRKLVSQEKNFGMVASPSQSSLVVEIPLIRARYQIDGKVHTIGEDIDASNTASPRRSSKRKFGQSSEPGQEEMTRSAKRSTNVQGSDALKRSAGKKQNSDDFAGLQGRDRAFDNFMKLPSDEDPPSTTYSQSKYFQNMRRTARELQKSIDASTANGEENIPHSDVDEEENVGPKRSPRKSRAVGIVETDSEGSIDRSNEPKRHQSKNTVPSCRPVSEKTAGRADQVVVHNLISDEEDDDKSSQVAEDRRKRVLKRSIKQTAEESVADEKTAQINNTTTPGATPELLQLSKSTKVGNANSPKKAHGASVKAAPNEKVHRPTTSSQQQTQPDLQPLPDILRVDLDILFIGINPGIVSSQKGHHYAGHNNHFWGCLFESGLVKEKLTYADDSLCPDRYNFGFTNIVSRCTRSCDELTRTELVAGGRELLSKIKRATPRIVAFVGVEVYDSFLEAYSEAASNPAEARAKFKRTSLGSQKWRIQVKKQNSSEIKVIRLFVMPSTSGRVVQYQKEDKLEFFKDLKALLDELKAS